MILFMVWVATMLGAFACGYLAAARHAKAKGWVPNLDLGNSTTGIMGEALN